MIGYFDDAMKFLLFFLGVILELCYMGKMSPFRRSMFKYLGTKCHVCNLFSNASAKRQRKKRGREREREGERKEGTFGEKMRETAIKQERQNTDKLFNLD